MSKSSKGKYLIVIAGPTAVGKTSVAIQVAKTLDAEIFSCDSRQIYTEMTIGTAKPSADELAAVPHHFINHKSITERYTAGMYAAEAEAALENYFKEHNVAIMTGGTGLYIEALLEGLDEFPAVPDEILQKLELELKNAGLPALAYELTNLDPTTAERIDLQNARRVIRALSVCLVEGKPYSSYIKDTTKELNFQPICIALTRDREELYTRINTRVNEMMQDGLLQEVSDLQNRSDLRALQTVGYQELFQYLKEERSLGESVEHIKRNSRRYAKRQITWFKNKGAYKHIPADDVDAIVSYISESMS